MKTALLEFKDRFDVVFVDAPCSGSGTWRRRPDAKWRLSAENLQTRIADQRAVLDLAHQLVKPGGRLIYVTCSVLSEENVDQVAWFTTQSTEFTPVAYAELWRAAFGEDAVVPASADSRDDSLLLTPYSHGTDGFFFAAFQRASAAA